MADQSNKPRPKPKPKPKAKPQPAAPAPPAEALPSACNVVDCSTGKQQFWRFAGGKGQMKLVDVREAELSEPVPGKHLDRDASQMWRPHCQNSAWLPAEQVFFRVLQLPECDPRELPGMVELQLEKISPLPLSQAVWSFEVAPAYRAGRGQQTVVVMLAERAAVEACVNELEGAGYVPDRLEVAVLHQVMATPEGGELPDGAWIYPRFVGESVVCTVAWWDEGLLQNITQIMLTSAEHLNELTEQLTAATWAGEMEGWLTGDTQWHLVVDREVGERWLPVLNEWAGRGTQVQAPPDASALAAAAAARALRPLEQGNLLPSERRAQYHRTDVDRVLGGIFTWVLLLYVMFLAGYFVLYTQVSREEEEKYQEVRALEKLKKEADKLEASRDLLLLQMNSRLTALQVFKEVAAQMPEELKLDTINFSEKTGQGNTILLTGGVEAGQERKVNEFRNKLAGVMVPDPITTQPRKLFFQVDAPNTRQGAAGAEGPKHWTMVCLLRSELKKQ